MHDYFRGNPDGQASRSSSCASASRIRPEYRDRDARLRDDGRAGPRGDLAVPDARHALRGAAQARPEAVTLTFTAFNRWLEEDWGFAYRDRIFAAPYISLVRRRLGGRELEWALDRGARVVVHAARRGRRPPTGPRSPADPMFDPFWARVNEAGITVVVHAGDSGYSSHGYAQRRLRAPSFEGGCGAVRQALPHRARRSTTSSITLVVRQALRALPEPAHRVGRERLGVPARPVQEAASTAPQDARLLPRGPGRDLPRARLDQPVLGGRRVRGRRAHGRRPRDLRLRLAPHRGHARSRSTTSAELKEFDDDARAPHPARQRASS